MLPVNVHSPPSFLDPTAAIAATFSTAAKLLPINYVVISVIVSTRLYQSALGGIWTAWKVVALSPKGPIISLVWCMMI